MLLKLVKVTVIDFQHVKSRHRNGRDITLSGFFFFILQTYITHKNHSKCKNIQSTPHYCKNKIVFFLIAKITCVSGVMRMNESHWREKSSVTGPY